MHRHLDKKTKAQGKGDLSPHLLTSNTQCFFSGYCHSHACLYSLRIQGEFNLDMVTELQAWGK